MKNSIFGLVLVAALTGCGQGDPNSYQYSFNNCDTGKVTYSDKNDLCSKLADDKLNKGCALSSRKERFKNESCSGDFDTVRAQKAAQSQPGAPAGQPANADGTVLYVPVYQPNGGGGHYHGHHDVVTYTHGWYTDQYGLFVGATPDMTYGTTLWYYGVNGWQGPYTYTTWSYSPYSYGTGYRWTGWGYRGRHGKFHGWRSGSNAWISGYVSVRL
jgi:hypothetical protein